MPFDQQDFEIETKADPFSVEAFRDWLAEQVQLGYGAANYDFCEYQTCLLTQFFGEFGLFNLRTDSSSTIYGGRDVRCLPHKDIALDYPRTVGAALARANAYLERK